MVDFDKLALHVSIDKNVNNQAEEGDTFAANYDNTLSKEEQLPTRFRIDVFSFPNNFVFDCKSYDKLTDWVTALSTHWLASNSPQLC